jgi:succinoglycan biosynthesis transport protein ExoP
MLQRDKSAALSSDVVRPPPVPAVKILTFGTAFVHRNLRLILAFLALTVGSSAAYLVFANPRFTVEAVLYVEKPQIRPVQLESTSSDNSLDSKTVESQVEILKSNAIALSVVNWRTIRLLLARGPPV